MNKICNVFTNLSLGPGTGPCPDPPDTLADPPDTDLTDTLADLPVSRTNPNMATLYF